MIDLNIEKTRKERVLNWFSNINNSINYEILLLNFKYAINIKELKSSLFKNNENILILNLGKITKKDLNSKKNIILVANKEISLGHFEIFKDSNKRVLFQQIYNNEELREYTNSINSVHQKPTVSPQSLHLFYLSKFDTNNIYNSVLYSEYFISTFTDMNDNNILTFNKRSINLFLLRNSNKVTIYTILNDINYFKSTGILTSRLAIFTFKICTFYFSASDKEIGIFYANLLGIRSKCYSNKRFGIKNTKGYLLHNIHNIIEYRTKIQIASYLLNNNACDIDILQKATGLSFYELKNLTQR